MKARQITTTHKYGEKYDHVFKHYANAVEFRSRIRAKNIKDRNNFYRWQVKTSSIKTIEVADDYRKKDFWWWRSFKFTNDWLKWEWYKKHTEDQFLYWQLYSLRANIRDEFGIDERNNDIKFLIEDLNWYLNNTWIPKKERDKVARETLLFAWKTLSKYWKEWLIQEHTRWMYEDDFNEYCERMEKLQEDLVAEMK